jgi:hypothetical protein
MGKYFSNDSDLVNYAADIDGMSVDMTKQTTIPNSVPEIQSELRSDDIKPLSVTTDELGEKIIEISEQNQDIKKQFDNVGVERVKQTFKSFDELEVLERLNQITFLLMQQNNRLDAIEKKLENVSVSNTKTNATEERELTPREMYELEQQARAENKPNNDSLMNIENARKELQRITSGEVPKIPTEDFKDESVVLEEIFPDKDPEAYQEAYKAMEYSKKMSPTSGYSKSPKGGMSGANAGF